MPADTKPIDMAGLRVLLDRMSPRPWRWGHHENSRPSGQPESMFDVYGDSGRRVVRIDPISAAVTLAYDTDGVTVAPPSGEEPTSHE